MRVRDLLNCDPELQAVRSPPVPRRSQDVCQPLRAFHPPPGTREVVSRAALGSDCVGSVSQRPLVCIDLVQTKSSFENPATAEIYLVLHVEEIKALLPVPAGLHRVQRRNAQMRGVPAVAQEA